MKLAICNVCGQEKSTSRSCLKLALQLNGKDYEPVPWGKGKDEIIERCPGCGISQEGYHHPGCDYEVCPCCGNKVITCNCEQT
ncbi:MAG: hypothetical protein ACM3O9_06470 [Methylocystaceae bacterium]